VTYDTGALIAAERGDRTLWSRHRAWLNAGVSPTVPAGVLAEAWRGGPQANLSRCLAGCHIEPLTDTQARAVGALAARTGLDDTVDLAVAEGALRRGDTIVTSNPTHLRQATAGASEKVAIDVI
jgi:predicted nucleic acid-binding protein